MTDRSARYERLIEDLRQDFRPQREWGEGRGLFLVVGHFLVGVAAGAWLFGLIFGYLPGLITAFLLAGVGGIAHLAFLGRPERFWRIARQIRTSWVARGFIGLTLFLLGAALYLPPIAVATWPWGPDSAIAGLGWILAAIGMVILIVYMGFVYAASKGIPFWNSPLHPALYVAYAFRGGSAALMIAMALLGPPSGDAVALLIEIWMWITAAVIVLFAIELQEAFSGGNSAARRSVREVLAGRFATAFYGGILLVGLVVPMVLASEQIAPLDLNIIATIGLLSAFGDFFMKYTTIKAGIYLPLTLNPARSRWQRMQR
jgi:formate-dependent nitrite reductase membrane component NrfD